MNRLAAPILMLLIGGCVSTQADTLLTTPEEVSANFVTEVSALASNHSELAEFPDYVRNLESVSKVYFNRHLRPVTTKRRIRPSDFEKHGISLWFELDNGQTRRGAESTWLPHLNLSLFSQLSLWEGAPPELEQKLETIMERHKTMLLELDKKAGANKAIDSDKK